VEGDGRISQLNLQSGQSSHECARNAQQESIANGFRIGLDDTFLFSTREILNDGDSVADSFGNIGIKTGSVKGNTTAETVGENSSSDGDTDNTTDKLSEVDQGSGLKILSISLKLI
jgi:hypothetical protein